MANPRNHQVLEAVQSAGAVGETRSNGHHHVTAFVIAENLDGANDTVTVTVEGSPDGEHWANVGEPGSAIQVDETQLDDTVDESGDASVSVTLTGTPYEFLRLRVQDFTDASGDDLAVSGYIMAAGNSGSGTRGNPEQV